MNDQKKHQPGDRLYLPCGVDASNSNQPIEIRGIWLLRSGEDVVVLAEVDGIWLELIRENHEGNFSHCISPSGIRTAKPYKPLEDE